MNKERTIFGERLRILRKEKGVTQLDVAKEMGLSKGTIGMWEAGNREANFDVLTKLAAYFNTTSDYLIGITDKNSTDSIIPNEREIHIRDNDTGGYQLAYGKGYTATELITMFYDFLSRFVYSEYTNRNTRFMAVDMFASVMKEILVKLEGNINDR